MIKVNKFKPEKFFENFYQSKKQEKNLKTVDKHTHTHIRHRTGY